MQAIRTAALSLALSVAVPAIAQPAPPRVVATPSPHAAQAKALFDEARALYEKGQYPAAIEKLERARELDPGGTELVYNLAVLHEKLLEFDAAEAYFRHYLDIEPDPKLRERAIGTLRRIEGARRALAERRAPAEAPSAAPTSAVSAVTAAPPAVAAAPRRVDPVVLALGSVAGAALLTGGILGVAAFATSPGDAPATGPGVGIEDLEAQASRAHRLAVLADVSLLVGVLAGGTALFAYFARAPRAAAPPAVNVGWGPAGGRVQVSF